MEKSRLDEYLTEHGITNEQFAEKLRALGCRATGGWVSRIRTGRDEPGKKLARAIEQASGGAIRFDHLINVRPAADGEAA